MGLDKGLKGFKSFSKSILVCRDVLAYISRHWMAFGIQRVLPFRRLGDRIYEQ